MAVEEQQEAVSDVKSQFEEVGAELEALLKLETVEASERVTGLVESQERLEQKLTAVSEAKAKHREKQSPRKFQTSAVLDKHSPSSMPRPIPEISQGQVLCGPVPHHQNFGMASVSPLGFAVGFPESFA